MIRPAKSLVVGADPVATRKPGSEPEGHAEHGLLPRVWAVGLIALVVTSFRLWIPDGPLPPVPLVTPPAFLSNLPDMLLTVLGWCPVVVLFASLAVACWRPDHSISWWLIALSLTAAFVIDQHRLQPWAYQSAIYASVFATMSGSVARRWLYPLAISVYLYSGFGKLDYLFAHTVGQDLLEAMATPFGGLSDTLNATVRIRLALLFPAVELLIGVCLIAPRLRRVAGVAVIGMHLTLIALMGPWCLDHSLGVLLWNGLLICQAWLLFVWPAGQRGSETKRRYRRMVAAPSSEEAAGAASWISAVLVLIAVAAPIAERSGGWDHWLSWALYAPHSSRTDVEIHRSRFDRLDPDVAAFLGEDHDGDGWRRLSLSRWSLETLGVPIYPQARYQLGLACELGRRDQLGDGIRVRIRSVAKRWTGSREEEFAVGLSQLREKRREIFPVWWSAVGGRSTQNR